MKTMLIGQIKQIAIMVAIAFAFTWFGVYGTAAPFHLRFIMWTVTMLAGGCAAIFVMPFVFGTRFESTPLALRILAGAALIAVPVTLALLLFNYVNAQRPDPGVLHIQFLYVFAICIVMVIGGYVVDLAKQAVAHTAETGRVSDQSTFKQRLPLKYRDAELHAISSEDHYLRVYTSLGEELILMRLADAVRELEGTGGLRTHRSWWVSKAAVKDATRDGTKAVLTLESGLKVPVSRTYQSDAKDAGLI